MTDAIRAETITITGHGGDKHLTSLETSNGKIGVIEYCPGGRQAFLAACSLA